MAAASISFTSVKILRRVGECISRALGRSMKQVTSVAGNCPISTALKNQFRKANRNRPPLTAGASGDTFQLTIGGLAQLGERLAGSQKVSGSSPLSSTFLLHYA